MKKLKDNGGAIYMPPFRIFPHENSLKAWQKIFKQKPHIKYPAKTVVLEQGVSVNHLFYIFKGLVEYKTIKENGDEFSIELLGDNNLFGLQSMFNNDVTVGEFMTLSESSIVTLSKEEVIQCINEDKTLVLELLEELAAISGSLIKQLYIDELNAEQRIIELLCAVSPLFQNSKISLSQSDIARLCRTSRVTVAKTITALKSKNIIDTAYGEIIITDFTDLEKCKLLNN